MDGCLPRAGCLLAVCCAHCTVVQKPRLAAVSAPEVALGRICPPLCLIPECAGSQLWLVWGSVGVLWMSPALYPVIICGPWLRVSATMHVPRLCLCWLALESHSLDFQ